MPDASPMTTKRRGPLARVVAAALVVAALVCAPMARPTAAVEPAPQSPEYVIKAAYLYNFAMFVEWPADAFSGPSAPIVIGIVGADPFGSALERIVEGKRINKRRLVIDHVQSPQEARRSHILFVGAADPARLPEFASRLSGQSVLVVGEAADVVKQGGTIGFTVRDNKVGYDINLDAAKRARLTISSKLLNLARVVRG
jgi:YfiR/HmsC-like